MYNLGKKTSNPPTFFQKKIPKKSILAFKLLSEVYCVKNLLKMPAHAIIHSKKGKFMTD